MFFTPCQCVRGTCVTIFFLSLHHLLHFFSVPLASIFLSGISAVSACSARIIRLCPVSYCYSVLVLPCPMHVPHLPLVFIVVAHAVSVLSLFLVLHDTSLSVSALFCPPASVGWLHTLVVFFSVCCLCIAVSFVISKL